MRALLRKNQSEYRSENGDRPLNLYFSNSGWGSFFYDELGATEPDPYIDGEDILAFDERRRRSFHQSLKNFPMLSRIHDYYEDVFYRPDEIHQLLEECSSLEVKITDPEAQSFLNGMIYACKEAERNKTGLFLASD
jgi:hypothetical protein